MNTSPMWLLRLLMLSILWGLLRTLPTQAQSWQAVNSPGSGQANISVTDNAGNVYTVGTFRDTATFGQNKLVSTNGSDDVFATKQNSSGLYLWSVKMGGDGTEVASSLAIDGTGHLYVDGNFGSRLMTIGSSTLSSSGDRDVFVTKINANNGTFIWATAGGGASCFDDARGVAVDAAGSVYLAGCFTGASTHFGSTILSNSNSSTADLYVAKLDSLGNWQWAISATGSDLYDAVNGIKTDDQGNIFLTGVYGHDISFGSTNLPNQGNLDVFVAKLSSMGVWQWATRAGGGGRDVSNSLAVAGNGDCYITGGFSSGTAVFGSTTLNSAGTSNLNDIFVCRLNSSGAWLWAVSAGSGLDEAGNAIALAANGTPYVTGYFNSSSVTFGNSVLANNGSSNASDIFVARLTPTGSWTWAVAAGGPALDAGSGIAVDGSDNVYVTGSYTSSPATFGSITLPNSTGGSNIFIARIGSSPAITTFTPSSGPTGTNVTLTGSNLLGATTVTFNGTPASSFTVTSATSLTATVPAGAGSGLISVTTPGGTASSSTPFSVTAGAGAPRVTRFTPASGPVGINVIVKGTNFTGTTAVRFNGIVAPNYTVNSATQLTVRIPSDATTGKISVTTPAGTATSTGTFKVVPTLTSFTPTSGAPGTGVTITGTGFMDATAVKFNTITTTNFTIVNATTISVEIPATATSGKLAVVTPGGTATSASAFSVAPSVTNLIPAQGAPGSVVLVQGLNLTNGTTVRFNGASALSTLNNTTQLTTVVPATATTGPVSATNSVGTGTSIGHFTVVSGAYPTIATFSPTANVIAGTVMTLTGTNFTGATLVRFNNVNAASYTIHSPTRITVTVPPGATTGKIYVANPSGMGQSMTSLTIFQPPTLSSISPTRGAVNSVVVLLGANLNGATSVLLNGVAVPYVVNASSTITATIPAGASSGAFSITTLAGTATSVAFTVLPGIAPSITALSPVSGLRGSTVVLTGSNFTGVRSVRIGAIAAVAGRDYIVNSPSQITLTLPSTATTGRLYVTTAGGGMAQSPTDYTVILLPTITSFTPASGVPGTVVTINGSNFNGISSVKFGGVAASSFTIVSTTKITAVVPSGAVTGTITASNPVGTASSAGTFTYLGLRAMGRPTVEEGEAPDQDLVIWPNPARDVVQFSGATGTTVVLVDLLGRPVATTVLVDGYATLDVHELLAGMYYVRAGNVTRRLVVTKD